MPSASRFDSFVRELQFVQSFRGFVSTATRYPSHMDQADWCLRCARLFLFLSCLEVPQKLAAVAVAVMVVVVKVMMMMGKRNIESRWVVNTVCAEERGRGRGREAWKRGLEVGSDRLNCSQLFYSRVWRTVAWHLDGLFCSFPSHPDHHNPSLSGPNIAGLT